VLDVEKEYQKAKPPPPPPPPCDLRQLRLGLKEAPCSAASERATRFLLPFMAPPSDTLLGSKNPRCDID